MNEFKCFNKAIVMCIILRKLCDNELKGVLKTPSILLNLILIRKSLF